MGALYLSKGREMKLMCINENFQIQKYIKGQGSPKKCSTPKVRIARTDKFEYDERSFISIVVFLNDMCTKGGELNFYEWHDEPKYKIRPQKGKCVLFIHSQYHEDVPVFSEMDEKYVLRANIMYRSIRPRAVISAPNSARSTEEERASVMKENPVKRSIMSGIKRIMVWTLFPTVTAALSIVVSRIWFPKLGSKMKI